LEAFTPASQYPDEEEHDIVVRSVAVSEFEQRMLEGDVRDGCTLAAWALYLLWKKQGLPASADSRSH